MARKRAIDQPADELTPPISHHRLLTRRNIIGLAAIGFVAGVGLFSYFLWSSPVIDRSLVKDAEFSVYAPRKAPDGYVLQEDLTRYSSNTLTYGFLSPEDGGKIVVTVQPLPNGFDMTQMTEGGSIDRTNTPQGTLYNLSAGGASKYLLNTGDSLIFLTSDSSISTASINSLVEDLVKLN